MPDNLDNFLCIGDWIGQVTIYKQIWLLLLLGSAADLHICRVGTLKLLGKKRKTQVPDFAPEAALPSGI